MTVEVIVCTKDRARELALCLGAVASQTRQPNKVLVIDASENPAHSFQDVKVVPCRPGLTGQRNLALRMCRADVVVFIDDDAILDPQFLARIKEWFDNHPACVGVGGNIVNDPIRSKAEQVFRRLFGLADADGRLRRSGEANYLRHPDEPTRVDVISGSNMAFRRDATKGLRFDEELEGYGYMEDVDFCLQIADRGELWTIPQAQLEHRESPVARISQRQFVYQVFVNGARLFRKHKRRFGLRTTAFARRMLGRSIAYLAVSLRSRSGEPVLGMIDAFRDLGTGGTRERG